MGYRRQNTCSYCWKRGHNKMGCPEAKAKANDRASGDGTLTPLQQYDKYCADNGASRIYTVGSHFGWDYKIREAVEIQLAKRSRSRKVKKCVYCQEVGHNKRTCRLLFYFDE